MEDIITVNLFDDTFRHDVCSVAGKTPRHVRYVRDRMEWDGVTLFVDGYVNRRDIVDGVRCPRKVGWLHEPACLHPENYENNPVDRFEFILTCHAPLLALPGYRFAPYGGVWLPRAEWGLRSKSKLVSMLIGDKLSAPGHRLRQAVAGVLPGVDFYGSWGQAVGYGWQAKREVLSDYAFSVVTETCREDNLFTEWLLDCFVMGTIPVFWGCPNLGEFFDPRGVLAFRDAEEAGYAVAGLSFEFYRSRLPYMANNFRLAYKYEITEDWIYQHVLRDM